MANPIDPNAAARGLRMPGVISGALSSAGDAISGAASSLRDGATSLYNRMAGPSAPVQPAAPAAPAPQSASTPLPKIDPDMASRPAPAAPGSVNRATATMRAPSPPPIPTLTDVIQEGPRPFPKPPQIPTLTDVIEPGKVPPPAFGMDEAAAFNAQRAAAGGGAGAGVLPVAPPAAISGPEAFGRSVGRGVRAISPSPSAALNGLAAAASFAPHWHAFDDDSKLTAGQQAKLILRDGARGAAGLVGGIAGGALGGAVGSAAGPVGTFAGGAVGSTALGAAGYNSMDHVAGDIRRGLNWANEKLGGSPDYITDTDEDLRKAGFDPNTTVFDMLKGASSKSMAAAVGKPAAGAPAVTAPAAPAAPSTPDDIAAFNARMKQVGADSISMRAGPNDTRVIGNDTPASKEMQDYTAQRMNARTVQLASADNSYRDQSMRQHAATQLLQDPDVMRMNDEVQQAQRSGSPAAIQAAYNARDSLIRVKSGDRQADTQANVAMRGQDVTERDAHLAQQTAQMVAQRTQFNADRQYQLDTQKFGADQAKTFQAERETAQKNLAENLGKQFVGSDGKPDTARVGDALTKLQEELGTRIAQAQAVPETSPHYKEAQQLAQALSTKGFAALDADDQRTLMSQLAIRDRVKQTHGHLPGSATFVDSELGGYGAKGMESNLLGSDTVNLRNGGSIRANDLRYTEPANLILPDGMKQRTDQFNAGLGLRKQ